MSLLVTAQHVELLIALRRAAAPPRIVVIGASAIAHHVPLARMTADVDLAIVAEPAEVARLMTWGGWRRDESIEHRWRHPRSNSIVDVLAATERILHAGTIRLDGDDKVMSMVGFDIALANTVVVPLEASHTIEVAGIPALAILKIVAWLDRPYDRTKDLGDLARILDHALDDWDQRRWEEPLADIEHEDQSAFFVGGELGAIVRDHHRPKLDEFFARVKTEA